MKKTLIRTLKIKVDSKSLSALDINELENWENEGGRPTATTNFTANLSPVRKGEIFEVIGGDIHYEDGELVYVAEIELLALP